MSLVVVVAPRLVAADSKAKVYKAGDLKVPTSKAEDGDVGERVPLVAGSWLAFGCPLVMISLMAMVRWRLDFLYLGENRGYGRYITSRKTVKEHRREEEKTNGFSNDRKIIDTEYQT